MNLLSKIRDVPDFPKKGVLFKDITTLLKEGPAFHEAIDQMVAMLQDSKIQIDKVAAVESRGFIFGAPIAYKLGVGIVPVRKLGKLPAATVSVDYSLEYGVNTVEMHTDGVEQGEHVLVVDDLLATGGTTRASVELVEKVGGIVTGVMFLIELEFLNGRQTIGEYPTFALLKF